MDVTIRAIVLGVMTLSSTRGKIQNESYVFNE